MPRPIIATTMSGLFISEDPWKTAHKQWFAEMAEALDDESVLRWQERPDYFQGVDEVMERLHPELSDEERTRKARERYFEIILEKIREDGAVNRRVQELFEGLKDVYRLALVTTNTKDATEAIIREAKLEGLFDIIVTSRTDEKDDKEAVFERLDDQHGRPILYVGGSREAAYTWCKKRRIHCVFANFSREEPIEGVHSVQNPRELEETLDELLSAHSETA